MSANLENSTMAIGLEKVSFHSNPKERIWQRMFKILCKLHSLYTLAKQCPKSFKLGFSSTWTENFQMYTLDLEKAEKSEIRLPTPTGTQKKQGNYRKISISASLTTLQPLTVLIATICGKFFFKRWEYQTILPVSWETCMQVKKKQLEPDMEQWFKIGKGVCQGCILSPCTFNLHVEYIMWNARLESKVPGEISITSDMPMIPL